MEPTTNTKLAAFCNYHLWKVQELLMFVIAFVFFRFDWDCLGEGRVMKWDFLVLSGGGGGGQRCNIPCHLKKIPSEMEVAPHSLTFCICLVLFIVSVICAAGLLDLLIFSFPWFSLSLVVFLCIYIFCVEVSLSLFTLAPCVRGSMSVSTMSWAGQLHRDKRLLQSVLKIHRH